MSNLTNLNSSELIDAFWKSKSVVLDIDDLNHLCMRVDATGRYLLPLPSPRTGIRFLGKPIKPIGNCWVWFNQCEYCGTDKGINENGTCLNCGAPTVFPK